MIVPLEGYAPYSARVTFQATQFLARFHHPKANGRCPIPGRGSQTTIWGKGHCVYRALMAHEGSHLADLFRRLEHLEMKDLVANGQGGIKVAGFGEIDFQLFQTGK
jgi:hypothetical protein